MTTYSEHCPRCERITDHITDPQSAFAAICLYCNLRRPVIGSPSLVSRRDPTLQQPEPVGFYHESPTRWVDWLLWGSLALIIMTVIYAVIIGLFLT